jgi:hypothetical protein
VDGGTDSGVMRIMGQVREAARACFPLRMVGTAGFPNMISEDDVFTVARARAPDRRPSAPRC